MYDPDNKYIPVPDINCTTNSYEYKYVEMWPSIGKGLGLFCKEKSAKDY